MSRFQILKPIDLWVSHKVDELMAKPEFQKIIDDFSALDEEIQESIKIGLVVLLFLVPFTFTMILWSSNASLREDIQLKKELIAKAKGYITQSSLISSQKSQYLDRAPLETESMTKQKIDGLAGLAGIDPSGLTLENFQATPEDDELMVTNFSLIFKGLDQNQLFSFIQKLSIENKFKLSAVKIKKNKQNQNLEGELVLDHYSIIPNLNEDIQ